MFWTLAPWDIIWRANQGSLDDRDLSWPFWSWWIELLSRGLWWESMIFFCRCLCILENHAGELDKIKWHHFQKTHICMPHPFPWWWWTASFNWKYWMSIPARKHTQRDYRWSSTNLNTSHLISPNHPAGPDIPPLWMVLGLSCWGCRMFCTVWLETPASPCWRLGWLSYQIRGHRGVYVYNLSRWNLRWNGCRRITGEEQLQIHTILFVFAKRALWIMFFLWTSTVLVAARFSKDWVLERNDLVRLFG